MKSRISQPAMILPGAMEAMFALNTAAEQGGVPAKTIHMAHLRASQINGCSVCVELHAGLAKQAGETDQRLIAVGAWRDAPYFNDAERAALALTECITRLSDRSDPVPDDVWNEAAKHYDEKGLAALVLAVATVNVWNRLNVATRQVAGEWMKTPEAKEWLASRRAARA